MLANFVIPLTFVVFYSTGYIASYFGTGHADIFTFQSLRLFIPIIILAPICWTFGVSWPQTKKDVINIMVVGFLIHGVCFTGILLAYKFGVQPGVVALILGLHPPIVAVGALYFLKEGIPLRATLGLVLGCIGVVFVVWAKLILGIGTLTGFFFAIFAVLGLSASALYQKAFCAKMDLRTGSLLQHLAAFIPIFCLSLLYENWVINWNTQLIGALLWMGIVLSLGNWMLFYILVKRNSIAKSQVFFFLIPPITTLLSWFILDEKVDFSFMFGMSLTVCGVFLVSFPPAKK